MPAGPHWHLVSLQYPPAEGQQGRHLMPVIEVKFGDGAWPELDGKQESGELVWLGAGAPAIRISAIEGGMVGGDPSIAIRFDLPDGRVVVAETSVRAFQMAAAALRGKFGAV